MNWARWYFCCLLVTTPQPKHVFCDGRVEKTARKLRIVKFKGPKCVATVSKMFAPPATRLQHYTMEELHS